MATNKQTDGVTQLAAALPQLDQDRLDTLNDAISIAGVRNAAMTSEVVRLTKKYGSNDPRVKVMAARIAQYPALSKVLNAEVTRVSSTIPVVTADHWLVQGHVYNADMSPAPGVTVFFANSDGSGIKSLGFGCTDKGGFYSIQGTADVLKQIGDISVFLSVSDSTQKVLYVGTFAVSLKLATANVQNIFLTAAGCQSPPYDR